MKTMILVLCLLIWVNGQADDDIVFDEAVAEPAVKSQEEPEPMSTSDEAPSRFEFNQDTLYRYRFELLAICGIIVYLLMYRKGRSMNSVIIEQFYQRTREYFFANFAHVGFTKKHGE